MPTLEERIETEILLEQIVLDQHVVAQAHVVAEMQGTINDYM
jgi:hypothetical protein